MQCLFNLFTLGKMLNSKGRLSTPIILHRHHLSHQGNHVLIHLVGVHIQINNIMFKPFQPTQTVLWQKTTTSKEDQAILLNTIKEIKYVE